MHFGRDGDVRKEGVVPAHKDTAAFKVFDNVKDLLSFRLPHHPSHIQQGGDMLLPVEWKNTRRKEALNGVNGILVCLVSSMPVNTLSKSQLYPCHLWGD